MGLPAIQVSVELAEINCGECGGTYAINERYRQQKYEKGESWNCPYCRTGWGYEKGENAKLKEQLAAEQQRLQRALTRENEERAAKEKLARKLKRVDKGVCPECKRTFQNLARHMCSQHGKDSVRVGKPKIP